MKWNRRARKVGAALLNGLGRDSSNERHAPADSMPGKTPEFLEKCPVFVKTW